MKIIFLMICMGNLYNQIQCQDLKELDLSGKNLREIPLRGLKNITKLNLRHNNITLTLEDSSALVSYLSLTELDLSQNNITELLNSSFRELHVLEILILSNNYITSIGELTFSELKNLKVLDLSFNVITHLPATIQIPSLHLEALNLQNNTLTNLNIEDALKELTTSLKITLSGNPWNCDCALTSLSLWLNNNTVVLENENNTLCATPKKMANYKIKEINTAQVDVLSCSGIGDTSSITASIPSFNNFTSLVTMPFNGTNTTSTKGNSWTFLVGVVVVGIVTCLLILIAVKFPRWYNFILSYNHHRLKEEEPYMFEEEFNVDFSMGDNDRNQEDVVVFEQTHSFVLEEDGFIEDKYIDERDITES